MSCMFDELNGYDLPIKPMTRAKASVMVEAGPKKLYLVTVGQFFHAPTEGLDSILIRMLYGFKGKWVF